MSAATPGQALWESLLETGAQAFPDAAGGFSPWEKLPGWQQERMEAAAEAAIGHYREHSTDEERDLGVFL